MAQLANHSTRANWYKVDSKHGARSTRFVAVRQVDSDEAMAILRRCSADYRPPYEFAEDDLAASVFWFSRSNHDLIEICLNGPESITTRVELPVEGVPWLLKPFLGTCRHEETLDSMEGAVERVRQFFELSAAEFRFLLTAKA